MSSNNSDSNTSPADQPAGGEAAAELIRRKIERIYQTEPGAKQEMAEAEASPPAARSKHQQFMHQLTASGKSLAEIQTAWHEYYVALSDREKHVVWQEFYAAHDQGAQVKAPAPAAHHPQLSTPETPTKPVVHHVAHPEVKPVPRKTRPHKPRGTRSVSDIKQQLLGSVERRQKLSAKHHAQSLVFGLALGSVVLLFLLFGFFNERFIAPLITPSRRVSSTPIIIDPNSTAADGPPEVIIPKINVEIPVVYDEPSIAENAVETALERGVVHYATTPSPGEQGNVVIFGHSSNNIFNKGQYKFAFVLLSRLDNGDVFYLTKDGKRYAYKVYDKKIVKPTDVGVMGAAAKPDSATLITCDPPGTSLNRLVVTGEQISPDPTANTASTAIKSDTQPKIVPSNSPSLWSRLTSWFSS